MTLEEALAYVDNPVLDVDGLDWTTLEALAKADHAPAMQILV